MKINLISCTTTGLCMKTLVLFLCLACLSLSSHAQLSKADSDSLTKYLNILSKGWDGNVIPKSNAILGMPNHSWQDWQGFFDKYYSIYPLTYDLQNYMRHPLSYWFNPDIRYKLQQGQKNAFLNHLDSFFSLNNVGQHITEKPIVKEELHTYLHLLHEIVNPTTTALHDSSLNDIDARITGFISKNPLLKRNTVHRTSAHPYMPVFATKLHAIFLHLKPLTLQRIDFISKTVELPQVYRRIFSNHKLFIADNNSMRPADIAYLDKLLSSVPKQIHQLTLMTHRGYLYAPDQTHLGVAYELPTVNVFSTLGEYQENGFPDDVEPHYADVFSIVAGHELNHRVDPDYIYKDSVYFPRRRQLLAQAGSTDLNYLRSAHVGAGNFFQEAPQEFFASISNQYLANTKRTLELGIKRFRNNYKEPINQFLYFAEIYSLRGPATRFYTNDNTGNLNFSSVIVKRNINGHINEFSYDNTNYKFTLDASGNVLSIVETSCKELLQVKLSGVPDKQICAGSTFTATATPVGGYFTGGSYVDSITGRVEAPESQGKYIIGYRLETNGCSVDVLDTFTVVKVVGGETSGSSTVCSGNNSGQIFLKGSWGYVSKWQSSIDGGLNWTDIPNIDSILNYSNLTQTTQYRAVVSNGDCPLVTSTVSTITVNKKEPLVVNITSSSAVVPATINVQNPLQGTVYTLYKDNVSTGMTGSSFTITQQGSYSVQMNAPQAGCWDKPTAKSNNVSISVTTTIIDPSVSNEAIHIYPNPLKRQLYITSVKKDYEIQIYNTLGQRVLEHKVLSNADDYPINIEVLMKGKYYLNIYKGSVLLGSYAIIKL